MAARPRPACRPGRGTARAAASGKPILRHRPVLHTTNTDHTSNAGRMCWSSWRENRPLSRDICIGHARALGHPNIVFGMISVIFLF